MTLLRTCTIALLPLLLAAGLAAPAAGQAVISVATESFDYPTGTTLGGQSGGTGWFNDWWAGPNGDAGIVTSPGFDPLGNKLTTVLSDEGCYRIVDQSHVPWLVDPVTGTFGKDDTTFWIRFTGVRSPGGDDTYGGFSLNWQFVTEQLFIGSPSGFDEWGIHDHPWLCTNCLFVIAGTHTDNKHTFVARIDHLPGQDRVQLWLDPPTNYPTTPADLDEMVDDLKWNEVRFQSGKGFVPGYDFDDLVIETPAVGPVYSLSNLVGGQNAQADVVNLTPGNQVIIAYSLTGAGPTNTPLGQVAMSQPIIQLPVQTADPSGEVHVTQFIPPIGSGRMVWSQAAELFSGGGGALSNPLAEMIQ